MNFENLDFFRTDSDALVSVQFIVMTIAFGLIIAFIAMYYHRQVIGAFVRAIRTEEALDESSAKTLKELGQENNISAVNKLSRSASLQKLISISGAEIDAKGKLVIGEHARFYISKENEERARKQFGDNPDSLVPIIIGTIVLIGVVVVSFFIGK